MVVFVGAFFLPGDPVAPQNPANYFFADDEGLLAAPSFDLAPPLSPDPDVLPFPLEEQQVLALLEVLYTL